MDLRLRRNNVMAIADDFELEPSQDFYSKWDLNSPTINDMHDYIHEVNGDIKKWMAVNNCDDYDRMRIYGVDRPSIFQRIYARLRGWHIMQGWCSPDRKSNA